LQASQITPKTYELIPILFALTFSTDNDVMSASSSKSKYTVQSLTQYLMFQVITEDDCYLLNFLQSNQRI